MGFIFRLKSFQIETMVKCQLNKKRQVNHNKVWVKSFARNFANNSKRQTEQMQP